MATISRGKTLPHLVLVKRERSEDEEPTRRVKQRTEGDTCEAITSIVLSTFLQASDDEEEVLGEAISKLVNLLYSEDMIQMREIQKTFFQVGGHVVVVGLMNKHPDFLHLQASGMAVLRNATFYTYPELEEAVTKVNGVQAILAAMKRFPFENEVNVCGLEAMCNLTRLAATAELLVTKANAVPFIISQMNRFCGNEIITEWACKLLDNLTCFLPLIDRIRDAEAVTALATAFDKHKGDSHIQHIAGKSLKRLLL